MKLRTFTGLDKETECACGCHQKILARPDVQVVVDMDSSKWKRDRYLPGHAGNGYGSSPYAQRAKKEALPPQAPAPAPSAPAPTGPIPQGPSPASPQPQVDPAPVPHPKVETTNAPNLSDNRPWKILAVTISVGDYTSVKVGVADFGKEGESLEQLGTRLISELTKDVKTELDVVHQVQAGKVLSVPTPGVVSTPITPHISADIVTLAQGIAEGTPVVLEASTAGKAVATLLKQQGCELHMAAPNKIPKPAVKTDKRDSIRLGQLYQSGSMPECYIPSPEIEYLRLLTRNRKDLAYKVTLVKNQIHALVTRNLLDSEMKGVSDWFGVLGLKKLIRLALPSVERAHLARHLGQLELLATQEESMQTELAKTASEHPEIQNLMTIPGVGYYSAVGIFAEIGDITRFPDKQHLASYAGLVSKADNSGEHVSTGLPVRKGNMMLKSFLCTAVGGMLSSHHKTAVAEFFEKKAKSMPRQKALVAAARKLSGEIWKMLTFDEPYREEKADLTMRKNTEMARQAKKPTPEVTVEHLNDMADRLSGKAEVLKRLEEETGVVSAEGSDAG